jgi:hypothetical protein
MTRSQYGRTEKANSFHQSFDDWKNSASHRVHHRPPCNRSLHPNRTLNLHHP